MGPESDREVFGDGLCVGAGISSHGGEVEGHEPLGVCIRLQLSEDSTGKGMEAILLSRVRAYVKGGVEDSCVGDGDQDGAAHE